MEKKTDWDFVTKQKVIEYFYYKFYFVMQNIFNHLWKIFSTKNIYVHISDVLFQEEKEKMKLYLTQLQMYN